MRRAWLTLICLLPALALAACGSSEPEAARAGGGPLPALDVVDLRDGGTIDLAAVPEAGKPLLVWFWAPH